MAASPPAAGMLSLPPKFLSDDDLLMFKENLEGKELENVLGPSRFSFPNEFPYEFDSPVVSSPFSAPGQSAETEENSDDEEDFLAGLTRRLALSTQRVSIPSVVEEKIEEKSVAVTSSPQSTLSVLGCWSASGSGSPNGPSSQVPSPPTTPFLNEDDAWHVISSAAGQVARLKTGMKPPLSHPNQSSRTLLYPSPTPDSVPLPRKAPNAAFYTSLGCLGFPQNEAQRIKFMKQEEDVKQQCFPVCGRQTHSLYHLAEVQNPEYHIQRRVSDIVGCGTGRYIPSLGLPQSEGPPGPLLQQLRPASSPFPAMRSGFPAGHGAKPHCAGTGVFLPRRYTNPSDSRKKSGCSNVFLPAKPVQATINFDDMAHYPHAQPRFSTGFGGLEYDSLLGRRNDILARQQSLRLFVGGLNQEMPLPQEWMY